MKVTIQVQSFLMIKADLWATKTNDFEGDNDLDAAKVAAMRAAESCIYYLS